MHSSLCSVVSETLKITFNFYNRVCKSSIRVIIFTYIISKSTSALLLATILHSRFNSSIYDFLNSIINLIYKLLCFSFIIDNML
ncbi:hypothetical protein QW060_09990 [Myroides ceti]|uniref:Uncharacterized protein n=1 Tax=Paenimyroides ceti TaxID=395087 RepID=A0ABT8CT92_9FLAO|nr:hypothetical protein [Paenimyroides ceti]MDN3707460.1 hypothetical protein [Paenimyroides ceti]